MAALVAIAVLYTTSEVKIVKNYLVALWICDIGHVVITFLGLGAERGMAVSDWNAMTWGNIGVTVSLSNGKGLPTSHGVTDNIWPGQVFLFLTRTCYLLGIFGPDRKLPTPKKKVQ